MEALVAILGVRERCGHQRLEFWRFKKKWGGSNFDFYSKFISSLCWLVSVDWTSVIALFVFPSFCLSVFMSFIRFSFHFLSLILFVFYSFCLLFFLSFILFVFQCFCLSIFLSFNFFSLFVFQSFCLGPSFCLNPSFCIIPSFCLFVFQSFCILVFQISKVAVSDDNNQGYKGCQGSWKM